MRIGRPAESCRNRIRGRLLRGRLPVRRRVASCACRPQGVQFRDPAADRLQAQPDPEQTQRRGIRLPIHNLSMARLAASNQGGRNVHLDGHPPPALLRSRQPQPKLEQLLRDQGIDVDTRLCRNRGHRRRTSR